MAKIMSIRPPEELRQKLKECAKRKGVTLNHLAIDIFWEWLEEQEKKVS